MVILNKKLVQVMELKHKFILMINYFFNSILKSNFNDYKYWILLVYSYLNSLLVFDMMKYFVYINIITNINCFKM